VDNGVQTGVATHSNIVAGLIPSTAYTCTVTTNLTAGGTFTATGTVSTTAFPSSTQITDATLGTPVNNNTLVSSTYQIKGDTFYNFISDNNRTYVTNDDTTGFNLGGSANMAFGVFTSESPLQGVNVNLMSGFGGKATCNGADNNSPKLSGIFSYHGVMYAFIGRQNGPECPGFVGPQVIQYYGTINVSPDHGATWANFGAPTSYNANGNMMSPTTQTMFANSGDFAAPSPIVYGADDDAFGCSRVDNCDAYLYMISPRVSTVNSGSPFQNGNSLLLARIPLAYLPTLDTTKIQYYTGGDGSLDANWSTSISSASPIISDSGHVSFASAQYIPSIHRYLFLTWYYPSISTTSDTIWKLYEGLHPWSIAAFKTTSDWTPGGFYNPVVFQRSALAGTNLTLLMGGDWKNAAYYNLWTVTAQLVCGGSNCP
jgi:hypothetical protein